MLIKAATHLRPILRLGVIQNPSSIPTTSTLGPNAFTSNSTLSQLSSVSGSLATTPAQNALVNANPQHPGSSAGSNGSWNAGSSGSSSGGKFGEHGYSGYARAFVNGSSSSGSGGLVGQLQSYHDEGRLARRGKTAGKQDERIRVLKEGRPLMRVVDVDAQERRRITAFSSASTAKTTEQPRNLTIVDVPEAMAVQSLATLSAKRAQQQVLDREDTISIDGDEDVIAAPKTYRLQSARRGSFTAHVPSDRSLWTVGIRAGQGRKVIVPVTAAQPIRLITTSSVSRPARRNPGKSMDDSILVGKSSSTVRRNSTASAVRPSNVVSTELTEAEQAMRDELDGRDRQVAQRIIDALHRGDYNETMRLVAAYRSQDKAAADASTPPYYTARTYNAILSALQAFRQPGDPISTILMTYNEMLERDVLPTIATYGIVIQALLERDEEVDKAIKRVARKRRWLEWEKNVVKEENGRDGAISKRRLRQLEQDERELEQLANEKNYESAIKLFRAAIIYNRHRPFRVASYLSLLGAAARRGDVETAIQVWGHHEGVKNSQSKTPQESETRPTVRMFTLLIQAYANARELSGIQEVLQEFMEQERKGTILDGRGQQPIEEIMRYVQGLFTEVLHAYIAAGSPDVALKLLDEMTAVSQDDAAIPGSLPQVSSNVVARCVFALVTNSDFDRALQLTSEIDSKFANALDEEERKMARSQSLEYVINEAISKLNVDVLVKALDMLPPVIPESKFLEEEVSALAATVSRALHVLANQERIPVDAVLHLLHAFDVPQVRAEMSSQTPITSILDACFQRGAPQDALVVLKYFADVDHFEYKDIARILRDHRSELISLTADFEDALTTTALLARYGCSPSRSDALELVTQYGNFPADTFKWTPERVSTMLTIFEGPADAVEAESLQGEAARDYDAVLERFVRDLGAAATAGLVIRSTDLGRLANIVSLRKGEEQARAVMLEIFGQDATAPLFTDPVSPNLASELGSDVLGAASEASTAPTSVAPTFQIDRRLSATVDAHWGPKPTSTPLACYTALKQGLEKGVVPEPSTVGRLLQSFARMGDEPKVRELYALAHEIVATSMPRQRQLASWVYVEDYMLIATCHLGHLEQAGMHRARIIEQGMAPSADAYATMISSTKDTTDDASVARELWEESQKFNVKPHLYLYNTIISKLSKARKAEAALDFFKNMKAEGLQPSSVTYGAVINACVRVGDVESATTLFQEMQSMPNFKPRVPPYNTMMQMHLQTQPSRELVLHYYNQMIQANVLPSAHTYKLLLDAYGTLEPIDLDAMQKVFDNLCKDRRVDVQGTHWASLIHAYGTVAAQPERAVEIFESIPTHPASQSNDIEPVCWEAILGVLASAKMTDRMEEYVTRMRQQRVRPTAYVNNMLIRGYASVGQLDKSRELFESMQDAVMGVAAPNNHPALLTSSGQSKPLTVAHTDIVFREPSTYEAMIRAELQAGNREAASALCDRLESRMYPVAVTSRIRSLIEDPNSPSAGLRS